MKRWTDRDMRRRDPDTVRALVRQINVAPGIGRSISGPLMRTIRERCGYSAREFAEFLEDVQAPITTTRAVYGLEARPEVPSRYIDAFRVFVGVVNFDRMLEQLDAEAEAHRRYREERARRNT